MHADQRNSASGSNLKDEIEKSSRPCYETLSKLERFSARSHLGVEEFELGLDEAGLASCDTPNFRRFARLQ